GRPQGSTPRILTALAPTILRSLLLRVSEGQEPIRAYLNGIDPCGRPSAILHVSPSLKCIGPCGRPPWPLAWPGHRSPPDRVPHPRAATRAPTLPNSSPAPTRDTSPAHFLFFASP